MSAKRFAHTLGVERAASELAAHFCPEKAEKLCFAALLHDLTKEYKVEKQLELCKKYGIKLEKSDLISPKLFHARTGAYLARERFGAAVDDEVFSAICYHTTGRRDMLLFEKLLYLADYIEDTRTFDDCVKLRKFFFSKAEKCRTYDALLELLSETMIMSYDMTIRALLDDNAPIAPDTVDARNDEIEKVRMKKQSI